MLTTGNCQANCLKYDANSCSSEGLGYVARFQLILKTARRSRIYPAGFFNFENSFFKVFTDSQRVVQEMWHLMHC